MPARTAVTPAGRVEAVSRLFWETLLRLRRRSGGDDLALMHQTGLTLPQIIALATLHRSGPLTVSEIAQCTRLSRAATSHLVDRLVRRGYVGRAEDSTDRRLKRVSLRRPGVAFVTRLERARVGVFASAIGGLSPATRGRLEAALRDVVAELEVER
jgi:DNA-binding MarR family transcriptional regulator